MQNCQTKPTQFGIKIGSSNRFGDSLNSKFQPSSSSNGWDMDIWKSKMAAIGKPAKPNVLRTVSKYVPVIYLGIIWAL